MITATNFNHINSIVAYLRRVPYDIAPKRLYDGRTLYQGYVAGDDTSFDTCFDSRVYNHFIATGKMTKIVEESLARAIHDHAMHTALNDFFKEHDSHRCVGVMGGHALKRDDEAYRTIALLSKQLTERGFVMISGGGPGAMEATHLGAWMAGRSMSEADDALSILAQAPTFHSCEWMHTAFQVMEKYEQSRYVSLGIPTWLYGHEPSTPLATHIAKFFENSIREDSILTLAYGGIIYAPGSAGTMQEIFQEAVQNHYLSFGFSSPMIFLGTKFWSTEMPVYPLLKSLMETGKYKNLRLTITDDCAQVIKELEAFVKELPANSNKD